MRVAAVFRRAGQRAAAEMGAPAASSSGERVLSPKGEPLLLRLSLDLSLDFAHKLDPAAFAEDHLGFRPDP
jgi:hypothetical protein